MGSTDGCGTKHWCSVDHVQTRNRPWPYCKSFLPSLYWFLESWAVHLGLLGHFWIVYKYTMGGPVWLVFVYLSFHFQLIKVSNFRAFSCPVSSGLWRRDFFFSLILLVLCSYVFHILQIDSCNGFYCENFRPNRAWKPKMFTELWTGWWVFVTTSD